MQHTMSIKNVICYIPASFNLEYELPEDSTDVRKHVGVLKEYTDAFVMCTFVWLHECFKQKDTA
jgi:hypothetical protein